MAFNNCESRFDHSFFTMTQLERFILSVVHFLDHKTQSKVAFHEWNFYWIERDVRDNHKFKLDGAKFYKKFVKLDELNFLDIPFKLRIYSRFEEVSYH